MGEKGKGLRTLVGRALSALALCSALVPASALAWEQVDQPVARERNQQARIASGASSGALTAHETQSLERQQAHIENLRRAAWSDGSLSTADRRRLTLAQNRASSRIATLKHNARHQ